MMLTAYRTASRLFTPLAPALLRRRQAAGKEDGARLNERLGHASQPRPEGPLVWLHAASVGEAQSILSLIERLRAERPALNLLVTTGTVTSAAMLAERQRDGVIHQYAPLDLPAATHRFIAHWRPELAIWIESELWPNLIGDMAATGRPMVLLNGRMSERSFRRWHRAPAAARRLLGTFGLLLTQTEEGASRFRSLGATDAACLGNLKYAAAPLPLADGALESLRHLLGGRPVWVAGSIHPGEDQAVLEAHQLLHHEIPDLLTLAIPRHPAKADGMRGLMERAGVGAVQRSLDEVPGPETGIYLADTMGELGLFYRLDAPVFVGGSLVRHGGQNVLEPARFARALLSGPHSWNFTDVIEDLRREEALIEVESAEELAHSIARLLSHGEERNRLGERARYVATRQSAVLDRVLMRLTPLLPGP